MSIAKRGLGLASACLVAIAFPVCIISGSLVSSQGSQEQECKISFDEPALEVVFPIEPICYKNSLVSEQSEPQTKESSNDDVESSDVSIEEPNESDKPEEEQYCVECDPDNYDDEYDYECYEAEETDYEEGEELEEPDCDYEYEESYYEYKEIAETFISSEDFREDGVEFWNGYYWTHYSELALPGEDLDIPGRYTDYNGYVCDENDYICLASDSLPRGSVVPTPFGKDGKVYDCGCGNDYVLDVYCCW